MDEHEGIQTRFDLTWATFKNEMYKQVIDKVLWYQNLSENLGNMVIEGEYTTFHSQYYIFGKSCHLILAFGNISGIRSIMFV